MTISNEILVCANQLANQGKKPSVALVKAKLTKKVPLPAIISALKNWQYDPGFVSLTTDSSKAVKKSGIDSPFPDGDKRKPTIEQMLTDELTEVKKELRDIKLLIQQLSNKFEHLN